MKMTSIDSNEQTSYLNVGDVLRRLVVGEGSGGVGNISVDGIYVCEMNVVTLCA